MAESVQRQDEEFESLYPEGYYPRFYSSTDEPSLIYFSDEEPVNADIQEEYEKIIAQDLQKIGFFDEEWGHNLTLTPSRVAISQKDISIRLSEKDLVYSLQTYLDSQLKNNLGLPPFGGYGERIFELAKSLARKYVRRERWAETFVESFLSLPRKHLLGQKRALATAQKALRERLNQKFGISWDSPINAAPIAKDVREEFWQKFVDNEELAAAQLPQEDLELLIERSWKTLVEVVRDLPLPQRIYEISIYKKEENLYVRRIVIFADPKLENEVETFSTINTKQVLEQIAKELLAEEYG